MTLSIATMAVLADAPSSSAVSVYVPSAVAVMELFPPTTNEGLSDLIVALLVTSSSMFCLVATTLHVNC